RGGDRLAGLDARILAGEADFLGVGIGRLPGLALEAEFGPGREDQLQRLRAVWRLALLAGLALGGLRRVGRRRRSRRGRRLLLSLCRRPGRWRPPPRAEGPGRSGVQ